MEYVLRLRQIVGSDELLQIPSAAIALRDAEGRVLLGLHAHNEHWVLPGGAVDPGETPADAALREMWEETGLLVRLTRLLGVFGGPESIVRYRNGDRTSYVLTVFEGVLEAGTPTPDTAELLQLRFVSEEEARSLKTAAWLPEVLRAFFERGPASVYRAPTWTPPAEA